MTTHTPTISEQAHAVAAGSAARLPADVVSAFTAEQAALEARGVPLDVVAAGTGMPDGELLDVHGAPTSLTRLRDGRPAVVVFYRGAWCPYCNIALRTYQSELVPALSERGVELIAISPQKPDGSLTSAESNDLSYSVASDPGNQIATALGILTEPSPDTIAAQITLGLDLTEVNADGGKALPMPTVVVLDAAGIIRWIDVHPNYTTRSEVPDILAAVDAVS
ncbi:peroxiredoxin-like family protein [Mycolicibacterium canariasense]|nr:peroxiredoxin-like family protein [Mycolicibacterium canariasense]MCV7208845.1 AhpC/TSA family protein [Mycolicibacterium canariasense]ORV07092.1 peroxiredoxin [Mycolicibacterium canariasense]